MTFVTLMLLRDVSNVADAERRRLVYGCSGWRQERYCAEEVSVTLLMQWDVGNATRAERRQ